MESAGLSENFVQLSKSNVLESESKSGLIGQFLESAVYSGLEAPSRAITQIADHFAGTKMEDSVKKGFKAIGVEEPKPTEFGSSNWYAQQLGGAVGMMVPFLALRAGLNGGASKLLGQTWNAPSQSLLQFATKEAALSGATGLIYGSLLSPSNEANVGKTSFLTDRMKNGAADMASFAILGFSGPYMGVGFDKAAGFVERSSLAGAAKAPISSVLRSSVLAGAASGIPAGFVSAEVAALKDGRLLASSQEFKESMASMAFVGGAFAMGTRLVQNYDAAKTNAARAELAAVNEGLSSALKDGNAINNSGALKESGLTKEFAQNKEAATKVLTEAEKVALVEQALRRMGLDPNDTNKPVGSRAELLDRLAKSTVKKNEYVSNLDLDGLETGGGQAKTRAAKNAVPRDAAAKAELPGLDIVLGASGIEAPAHVGFLQALEDRKVPIRTVTGVSGGSLVAALYTNKYSPAEIKNILLSNEFRYPNPSVLAKCFHIMDPWNLYPYSIDFKPWVEDFVKKYDLKPQQNLRIVAADKNTKAPVVFEGTSYDLPTALAASTAALGLNMKPVPYQGRQLIDGFYYHPTPADLTKSPAIVSKIGFVSKLPTESLSPFDYFLHLRELSYYETFKNRYPDPKGHIIAETGLPDLATTTFGVSTETLNKLVDHAYATTTQRLQQPDAIKAIENAKKQIANSKNS